MKWGVKLYEISWLNHYILLSPESSTHVDISPLYTDRGFLLIFLNLYGTLRKNSLNLFKSLNKIYLIVPKRVTNKIHKLILSLGSYKKAILYIQTIMTQATPFEFSITWCTPWWILNVINDNLVLPGYGIQSFEQLCDSVVGSNYVYTNMIFILGVND